jgi:hypothetical protein
MFRKYNYFLNTNNELQRNVFNMTGVQFLFSTKGTGKVFSVEAFFFEIGTLFSLFKLIEYIFDILITWVLHIKGSFIYAYLKY